MTIQIAIAISEPFVTAKQFSELAKMPEATVKNKIRNGELPIRKKKSKAGSSSRETSLINMVALTLEGAEAYKGYIVALMISEWWLFFKSDKDLECLAIYESLEDIKQYIHRHFTAT